MATKESIEPCSPKEVGQLNISLVPHAKTIYKEFVFKTPRKFALDALHKRSPIMCTEEISYPKKSPISGYPQLSLSKSFKDKLDKNTRNDILSISPEIYKPILPFPILMDPPITILPDSPDKLLEENPLTELTDRIVTETSVQILKEHKCETCDKVCKTPAALKSHLFTHVDRKPYQCLQCHKYFKSENGVITHLNITHKLIGLRESGNVHQYFRKELDDTVSTQDPQKHAKEIKRRLQVDVSTKDGVVKKIRTSGAGGSNIEMLSFSHGFPQPVKAALLADLNTEQSQEKKVTEKVIDPLPIDHDRQFGALKWPCKECDDTLHLKHTFILHMSYSHQMRVVCETCKRVYSNEDTLKQHTNAMHAN